MERVHMNYLRDLIHRVRAGESDRQIAQDLKISRITVRKYREWAEGQGYLLTGLPLPDDGLDEVLFGLDVIIQKYDDVVTG